MLGKRRIKGSVMGMEANGAFVSCETNAEMHFETAMIPASSVNSGYFSEKVPGKQDWRMMVDGFLLMDSVGSDFKTLYQTWLMREPVNIKFRTRPFVSQFLTFEGQAWVQQGSLVAPVRGDSTWNIVFEGNGIINMDWEEFWSIIDANPIDADWPLVLDGNEG